MTTKPIRVAFVENVVANYRVNFFERLARNDDFEITVFCSEAKGIPKLKVVEAISGLKHIRVPAHGTERFFVWQQLPFRSLRRDYDIVCYYSNPRYLSTVFAATRDNLFGKKCVLRNHYKTAGKERLSERLRLSWTRRFKNILVYTRKEVEAMRQDGFIKHNIEGWGNGLNCDLINDQIQKFSAEHLRQWRSEVGIEGKTVLISVGRLISRNQFELVPKVLEDLRESENLLWCVIGDGPWKNQIEKEAAELGVSDMVRFLGPMYNEEELSPWFLNAVGLIHPGTIGLSMIHAFAYGLPVVTHDCRRMHNPEFDAATNENSFLYPFKDHKMISNCVKSLCHKTKEKETLDELDAWKQEIRNKILQEYSTETMARRTAEFLRRVASQSSN